MDHIVLSIVVCMAQCAPTTVRIWDGDTAWFGTKKVRLVGFDPPERTSHARCPAEAEKAEEAREHLAGLLRSAERVDLRLLGGHSYDRRLDELTIDGRPAAALMIDAASATEKMAKRTRWCPDKRS